MRHERHARSQKIFAARRTKSEIEVALDAMTLTACLACDIFVRPARLTLKITAWLKGFCAVPERAPRVAGLSHAKKSLKRITRIDDKHKDLSLNRLHFSPHSRRKQKSAGPRAGAVSARLLMLLLAEFGHAVCEA